MLRYETKSIDFILKQENNFTTLSYNLCKGIQEDNLDDTFIYFLSKYTFLSFFVLSIYVI